MLLFKYVFLADDAGDVYLSQVPTYKGNEFKLESNGYLHVAVTDSVCLEVQKKVEPDLDSNSEIGDVPQDALATGLFGCHVSTSTTAVVDGGEAGTNVAFYKVK